MNTVNFLDRQIIGAVIEPIRREWGLTDAESGILGTAFTLLYAIFGVPLGRLADRSNRMRILAAGAFFWSMLTAVSGMAVNFWQLFAARLGVGVGEAVCAPASSSLIGDLYPAHRRSRALSIFMLGLPIGLGLGNGVGGWVAHHWGWRAAFYVAGIPGILCAAAALFMREPARGAAERHAIGARRREGSPYRLVLSIPTMWWIIAAGIVHTFVFYAMGAFLTAFLVRYHGVDLSQAGLLSMMIYGFSGIPVLLLAGAIGDRAAQWRDNGRLLAGSLFLAAAAPPMLFALDRPAGEAVAFSVFMGAGCAVLYGYYSAVYPTIHDIVEPSLRGTAMALYFCGMYVLGAALGPVGTGLASDYFASQAARAAGVLESTRSALEPFRGAGLHSAMYLVPAMSILIAIFVLAASRTLTRDARALRTWMASAADGAIAGNSSA
jgi:MFS family permease